MIRRVILVLLVSGLVFPQILYRVGFNPSSPELGLRFYFPVELGEIKALADLKLNITERNGNVFVEGIFGSDPVKLAVVDLDSVGLYYGFLEPRYPTGAWEVAKNAWKLRVGRSWIVFSDELEVWTDTDVLEVFVRSSRWRLVVRPFEFLGIGLDGISGPFVVFRYSDLEMSFWYNGFSFRLEGDHTSVFALYDDGTLSVSMGYLKSGEYISISNGSLEFVKRVGSVYVSGGFREKTPYISIEYPIQF